MCVVPHDILFFKLFFVVTVESRAAPALNKVVNFSDSKMRTYLWAGGD